MMRKIIRNILNSILKRIGNRDKKKRIWDEEFTAGKWDYLKSDQNDIVYTYIHKYLNGANLLDLGCGIGQTGLRIDLNKYQKYTGVDISEVAIQNAKSNLMNDLNRSSKNDYVCADLMQFIPSIEYRIILFRESIYYIQISKVKSVLKKYSEFLDDQGVFIIRLWNSEKHRSITNLINKEYQIIEKFMAKDSKTSVIIFGKS